MSPGSSTREQLLLKPGNTDVKRMYCTKYMYKRARVCSSVTGREEELEFGFEMSFALDPRQTLNTASPCCQSSSAHRKRQFLQH